MSEEPEETGRNDRAGGFLLLAAVFVLAACGLVYELIAGTLSSYLLGDSVTQFSLAIGLFLFGMGIGSYVSRFITKRLLAVFIGIEVPRNSIDGIVFIDVAVTIIVHHVAALLWLRLERVACHVGAALAGLVTVAART